MGEDYGDTIRAIIKDAFEADPPEVQAANSLVNVFTVEEILAACKGSTIPDPHKNAVVNAVSRMEKEIEP